MSTYEVYSMLFLDHCAERKMDQHSEIKGVMYCVGTVQSESSLESDNCFKRNSIS